MSSPFTSKQQRAMYYISLWLFVAGLWKTFEVIWALFSMAAIFSMAGLVFH